jgi:hypothetical protein
MSHLFVDFQVITRVLLFKISHKYHTSTSSVQAVLPSRYVIARYEATSRIMDNFSFCHAVSILARANQLLLRVSCARSLAVILILRQAQNSYRVPTSFPDVYSISVHPLVLFLLLRQKKKYQKEKAIFRQIAPRA